MYFLMRQFINTILGRKKQPDAVRYSQSGNLKAGTDCDLKHLSVHIANAAFNYLNVTIGNDCMLSGKIVLVNNKARVTIGDGVFIGPDTTLFVTDHIQIEQDVMISWGCTLIDTNAHSLHSAERLMDVRDWKKGPSYKNWSFVESSPITIQRSCWIGFNSIITKGVTLAEGTVVGCGSVVTKSTEPFGVYAGNPAQFIKKTD
jgi:acetyltransferase-like isoleucine patch superfamily enzyme